MIDVFRIGVNIGFTSNEAMVLGSMLRHLMGVEASTKHVNENLGRMRTLALGAVTAFAGFAVLRGIKDLMDSSKELNHQLEMTKSLGGDFARTVPQQYQRAFQINQQVPTSTPEQNAKLIRELGTQLNSPEEGMRLLPFASKLSWNVGQLGKEDPENAVLNLIKTAENRGAIFSKGADGREHVDAAKLQNELEMAYQAIRISGGLLTTSDLLQASKQGGVAARMQDPRAFYIEQGEMAVSMGASRVGTASTSLLQQLVGGTMPVHVAHEMQRVGLLRQGEWHSDHGHVVVDPSAQNRLAQITRDEPRWVREYLVPLLQKEGMNPQQQLQEIFKLFGRATTQRYIAESMQNAPQMERALGISRNMPGVEGVYAELHANDLKTNEQELAAAWQGLREAIGSPEAIKAEIAVLHGITDAIHALTSAAIEHPEAVANILKLAAAISAVMAVGGSLTVISFALSGFARAASVFAQGSAAVSGIVTLTGALAALARVASAPMAFLTTLLHPTATQPQSADETKGMHVISQAQAMAEFSGKAAPGSDAALLAAAGIASTTPEKDAQAAAILRKHGITGPVSSQLGKPADSSTGWLHGFVDSMLGGSNYLNSPAPPASPGPPEPDIHWQSAPAGSVMRQRSAAQGYQPNRTALQNMQMTGVVNLDGRAVGSFVARTQADQMSRPPAGPTAPDPRMSLPQPGQLAPTQ